MAYIPQQFEKGLATEKIQGYYPELEADFPKLKGIFCDDDISPDNAKAWTNFNQYSGSVPRYSPTVHDQGYLNDYCLAIETPNDASALIYARKSKGALVFPRSSKYLIFGCYVSWHAWWKYGMFRFGMGVDTQKNDTMVTTEGFRHWWKWCLEVSTLGTGAPFNFLWRVDSETTDGNPTWETLQVNGVDVAYDHPWNEPYKDMWLKVVMVVDYENQTYHKLYINGDIEVDLSDIELPTTDAVLDDYRNGLNVLPFVQNRSGGSSTTTNMSNAKFDCLFLATSN